MGGKKELRTSVAKAPAASNSVKHCAECCSTETRASFTQKVSHKTHWPRAAKAVIKGRRRPPDDVARHTQLPTIYEREKTGSAFRTEKVFKERRGRSHDSVDEPSTCVGPLASPRRYLASKRTGMQAATTSVTGLGRTIR